MVKRHQPPQRTAELLPAASVNGAPAPLVELRIERPEPLLEGAKRVLQQAKDYVVDSADAYAHAAKVRLNIRSEYEAMEARRKKMKAPTLRAGEEIDSFFKPALDVLEEALETISETLTSYDSKQRQLAEKRQREAEELARKQREEAEAAAKAERERVQMIMSEIQGIGQQVIIASSGRPGVRKGGTLECIDETLEETKAWRIDEEHFGAYTESAQKAKAAAIASIIALRGEFVAKQAANQDAVTSRAAALEARKAQLRAEEETRQAAEVAKKQQAESQARIGELEQKSVAASPAVIEPELPVIPGLSRPKTFTYELIDASKLKREYTMPDPKLIQAVVRARGVGAEELVGAGAIRVVELSGVRQRK
jgi:hypothetical protein